MKFMNNLDILRYRKLHNGKWEVYDKDGRSAEGTTKEDAKRLYYLYYKMPHLGADGYVRHGLISTEQLTLDIN